MPRSISTFYTGASGRLLTMVLLQGLAYSFVLPIMSYFIVEGLGQPPYLVGVYTVVVGLSSVLFSHVIGLAIDKGADNRKLLFFAVAAFGFASALFSLSNTYLVILAAGATFMGFGNAAVPLLLSLGRSFSLQKSLHIGRFNASLRAQISIAWILGAPLAFWVIGHFGFKTAFMASTLTCMVWLVSGKWFIPSIQTETLATVSDTPKTQVTLPILLVSAGLFFANMANSIYISAMPLYIILEHQQAAALPGWLMAMAAAIEIPVMLVAARWTHRISAFRLLLMGLASGCVFYVGMYFAVTAWQFLLLQIANGFFFGTFAGLGITLIQDLLPDRIGFSSALYTNTMRSGAMSGVGVMGVIATVTNYQTVLLAALVCVILSVLCLRWAFRQT